MTALVDSSVVLNWLTEGAVAIWHDWDRIIGSEILRLEVFRVLDRARLTRRFDDATRAAKTTAAGEFLESVELQALTSTVLERATAPFPTVVGSLDSIHLATALLWREQVSQPLTVISTDRQLRIAAEALGFQVRPRKPITP